MITGGVCSAYGLDQWGKLFTDRQLLALITFSDLIQEVRQKVAQAALRNGMLDDQVPPREGGMGAKAYAEAVRVYLSFAIDRLTGECSTIATGAYVGFIRFTLARPAIPMTWDF